MQFWLNNISDVVVYIVIPAAAWVFILSRIRKTGMTSYLTFLLLASLYPLGTGLQEWIVGPYFIRWYLADVGFISAFAFILMALFVLVAGREASQHLFGLVSVGIHSGFITALVVELAQLIGDHSRGNSKGGDWVDVVIFVVTYYLNLRLCERMRPELETLLD